MPAGLRKFGLAIGWGGVIGWALMAVMYALALQYANSADFGVYYSASETLRFSPHSDIYLLQTLKDTTVAHGGCASGLDWPYPYVYQPLLAILLEPLTLIPCHDAATVWSLFNFALWFGLAALLAVQSWRRYSPARALIVAMMTVFFLPILSGIHFGQIHVVLLVCMLAGITLIESDHELAGGAALGFGVVLKYVPAALVLYYLLRGRWRATASAAVVTFALTAAEALVVGPRRLLESISAGEEDVRSQAALFVSGHWMNAIPGGVYVGYLAALAFVTTVLWMGSRTGKHQTHDVLGASWSIATMLMLTPLAFWFYMTWLLPALLVCLDLGLRRASAMNADSGWRARVARWWPLATLTLCYVLLLVPDYNTGAANYRTAAAGTLLLWLLCGALYLWSAGVRLPSDFALARLWRRAPADATPAP